MDASSIQLPAPKLGRGLSFASALRKRQTTREISARALSTQTLSNLLWAACGVNRLRGPFGTPGITAASASNSQEIGVVAALEQGAYRFDALRHRLERLTDEDVRELAIGAGQRGRVALCAPVQLIYFADVDKLAHTQGFDEPGLHDPETQKSYYFVDAGLIAGNVYLFAATYGLAAWFHNCDRERLSKLLRLGPNQRVLFAQSVGRRA